MNTQNTPVHIRLWHRDFWLLAVANLLLTMSMYLLIPTFPLWMMEGHGMTAVQAGVAMGAFGAGMFAMGMFTSFLVQHYRRNQVFVWSAVALAAVTALLAYIDQHPSYCSYPLLVALRAAQGTAFGLAQMVLSSTLIIDTCESFHRTEANHSASWFARFALSLGPMAGLLVVQLLGFREVVYTSVGCTLAAALLVLVVNFPFRSPEDDIPLCSLDRYLLPQGWLLMLNLILVMTAAGILLSLPHNEQFYGMMMAGFLVALLAQRFVFLDADLKSEIVSGLLLLGVALLMMLTRRQPIVAFAAPLFVGLALGLIGSRFLLFFIKLSKHCQRGTSQSTFMLSWESGLAFGLCAGYALMYGERSLQLTVALAITIVALIIYNLFTHKWFLKNRNR